MTRRIETTGPRRSAWPFLVAAMLATHVGAMALAVSVASREGGNAVLPDYYERALHWDARRGSRAGSAQLEANAQADPTAPSAPNAPSAADAADAADAAERSAEEDEGPGRALPLEIRTGD